MDTKDRSGIQQLNKKTEASEVTSKNTQNLVNLDEKRSNKSFFERNLDIARKFLLFMQSLDSFPYHLPNTDPYDQSVRIPAQPMSLEEVEEMAVHFAKSTTPNTD